MIKLNVKREYVIPYEKDDISFSITWKFPFTSTDSSVELRKSFNDAGKSMAEFLDYTFLWAMKDQEGFIDEDGNTLDLSIEDHRRAIFDTIKPFTDYMNLVQVAYIGPKAKNLLAGLTQPSTGDGDQKLVESASTNVEKENVLM